MWECSCLFPAYCVCFIRLPYWVCLYCHLCNRLPWSCVRILSYLYSLAFWWQSTTLIREATDTISHRHSFTIFSLLLLYRCMGASSSVWCRSFYFAGTSHILRATSCFSHDDCSATEFCKSNRKCKACAKCAGDQAIGGVCPQKCTGKSAYMNFGQFCDVISRSEPSFSLFHVFDTEPLHSPNYYGQRLPVNSEIFHILRFRTLLLKSEIL